MVLVGLEKDGRTLHRGIRGIHVAEHLGARNAIRSLMGEWMEDHIRNCRLHKAKSSEETADELIEIASPDLK